MEPLETIPEESVALCSMEKLRSKLTLAKERIERFTVNSSKTGKTKRTKEFLSIRVQLLESYWTQFQTAHEELYENATAETRSNDIYFSDDIFSKIECDYIDAAQWLQEQLSEFNSSDIQNSSVLNTTACTTSTSQSVRLPKITLPSFSGAYLDWPSFHDTYESLIHNNDSLGDVQKIHYLKSALTGDAAKLIQHFSATSSNYSAAWTLIKARYDNPRVLVTANLLSIINLRPMAAESASELQRVVDNFKQSVKALENLSRPVDQWDDWLTHFLASKLDAITRKDWETSLSSSTEVPTFTFLSTFLERRLQALSAIKDTPPLPAQRTSSNVFPNTYQNKHRCPKPTMRSHHATTAVKRTCVNCHGNHILLFCPRFRSMSVDERIALLERKSACSNCLSPTHHVSVCPSANRCKLCQQKHHTRIHKPSSPINTTAEAQPQTTRAHLSNYNRTPSSILLATAILLIESSDGRRLKVRALLDQGSESSFITSSLANLLNLKQQKTRISVTGVGQSEAGTAYSFVEHEVISLQNSAHRYSIQSLVLPTLTHLIPSHPISYQEWPHVLGLPLADPDFAKPSKIDLILGAEVYAQVLLNGIRRGPPGSPIAQFTTLGWILSGQVAQPKPTAPSTLSLHVSTSEISTLLRRFWETEEPPTATRLTPDEHYCENHFAQTHYRNSQGRYVVRLPMKLPAHSLGSSRETALSALLRMERKFAHNAELHDLYSKFMKEYKDLGHMEEVTDETSQEPSYYLPHHAVMKPSSTTTKLRVVFNASQKTSSRLSLNDVLHTGPKLQNDVAAVILRWRMYPYVMTGDIEKMYRQISMDQADTNLQRILWRPSASYPVRCYRLQTVTYGTACAPYLACKTLQQLAHDYSKEHPAASRIIMDNLYVDDALFGAYDETTTLALRDDLCTLLGKGCLKVRKWLSSSDVLLQGIAQEDLAQPLALKVVTDSFIKTLGIGWSPPVDAFTFNISMPESDNATKRAVLADISRLYDPLGWLSPVIISAKIFLQKLWLAKLDWDDQLPDNLREIWTKYKRDLRCINQLQISRWVGVSLKPLGLELHVFSDASLSAYGAAVYLRVAHEPDTVHTSLLAAKTRVSPLKTISLPRLELCGAALLAEFNCRPGMHPSKWKVFIANRVSLIHEKVPEATWHHVQSADNPADCSSRGIPALELKTNTLWWSGPSWLREHSTSWPQPTATEDNGDLLQQEDGTRNETCTFSTQVNNFASQLLQRFSNLRKLIKITALCLRFVHNCRSKDSRTTGTLSLLDLNCALTRWIKLAQTADFSTEIAYLKSKGILPPNSKLRSTNPFCDANDVLRVGGRLKHAPIPYDEKFPIILPKLHHLTKLIIQQSHIQTLHGGIQVTLHHIRTKYWILNGRSVVRQFIRSCVVCCRHRATTSKQLMGDLPADRLCPTKPFLHSGIDYAGPFVVRLLKGRGHKTIKTYVAIFVCLSTRAIHLELVLDLSSAAFVAAFRRFVSRRGRCAKLYSDNARTFVAADKELSYHLRQLTSASSHVRDIFINEGTEWHSIPTASPHFGGIWEPGVKAFKHQFRRIVGSHTLALEEMLTLLVQIEACLNSRPLNATSDDPEDLTALTPGHFLGGEPLLSVPTPSTLDTSLNRLNRWQLVQHMHEQLWRRWSSECMHNLQLRYKWQNKQDTVKLHDLVLIKEDNMPPSKWLLGRIVQLHPGADGHTRVETVRHKNGHAKRAISKICVLPVHHMLPNTSYIHSRSPPSNNPFYLLGLLQSIVSHGGRIILNSS